LLSSGEIDNKDSEMKPGRTQAIVVGASMAGMLAARVLSDIFERVIVLERDTLPEGPQLRPGVPQARHLHALLPRGRRILEKNFPGITSELESAGAEILDPWAKSPPADLGAAREYYLG
jgi:2-polyprenyl-6-methoxyphenol hydroxylase-like FAD-dependent oxidoreductase